ncbi:putative non-specific serine/threonine protein kinase [Rosa chinensis]|uniref:Putative non-specific serine/threonine protein kinase n=1 Tax=Rosa chinensis TaxID=74649 RepID=A0A2P6S8C6_ROSCH|nr:putative non-specific serine/threonine protein kinase [Rosa chinensis]
MGNPPKTSVYDESIGMDISPRKVVWVANREKPLAGADTLARLRISSNGNLELVDGKQNSVWSINVNTW